MAVSTLTILQSFWVCLYHTMMLHECFPCVLRTTSCLHWISLVFCATVHSGVALLCAKFRQSDFRTDNCWNPAEAALHVLSTRQWCYQPCVASLAHWSIRQTNVYNICLGSMLNWRHLCWYHFACQVKTVKLPKQHDLSTEGYCNQAQRTHVADRQMCTTSAWVQFSTLVHKGCKMWLQCCLNTHLSVLWWETQLSCASLLVCTPGRRLKSGFITEPEFVVVQWCCACCAIMKSCSSRHTNSSRLGKRSVHKWLRFLAW